MDPVTRVQWIRVVPNVAKLIFKLEISRHAPASEDQIDEFQKGLEAQCIDACDTAMGELKSMENGYVSAGLGNEWTKFVAAARKLLEEQQLPCKL